jgi:hypothetical protein
MLSADVYPGPIAINSSDVFFWSAANTVIEGVPKGGGTPWPVSMQASGGADWPFAVDNSSVYYFAQNLSGSGGWYLAASPASPGDGSVSQPAIVGTLLTSQSVGMASAMVIFQGTIYSSWSSSGSYVVGSVPTSGGSLVDITSFPDSNGSLAVDGNGVYTVGVNNGPCEIDRAPLVGGSPSTLASGLDVCPSSLATDGVSLYFAGLVGTYDQNGNAVACALQVGSVPVTGGASVTVGSVVANEQPYQIAVDGSYAYVATNESLWKFPTSGGGTPTRMAGNLGVQVTSPTSDGCVYGNTGETRVVLALDESSAYLVVPSNLGTSGGVLLKIAK